MWTFAYLPCVFVVAQLTGLGRGSESDVLVNYFWVKICLKYFFFKLKTSLVSRILLPFIHIQDQ